MCKLLAIVLPIIIVAFNNCIYANAQIISPSKIDSIRHYTSTCYVDYAHIEKEISKIYQQLPIQKWKGIIAITRGGLYPSLILAYKLDINRVDSISLASYNKDNKQGNIKLLQDFNFKNKNQGDGWLVIDDLVDSGKTIKWLRQYLPKAYYVVIYAKPKGIISRKVWHGNRTNNLGNISLG